MLWRVFNPKYYDPSSPIVDVYINKKLIQNTLIELGAEIIVMTKNKMLQLNLNVLLNIHQLFFSLQIDIFLTQ